MRVVSCDHNRVKRVPSSLILFLTVSTIRPKFSSQRGDLSPPTVVCSGSQCSFLETLLKKMRRFYLTGTTSGSIKLGSVDSSFLTWNKCFHYHICSPCLFPGIWIGIWSVYSRVSWSRGSLIVLLFPSAIVWRFLNYSQARWNRSFQQARLLSNLQFSSSDSWKWSVNSLSLTFGCLNECTQQQPLGG